MMTRDRYSCGLLVGVLALVLLSVVVLPGTALCGGREFVNGTGVTDNGDPTTGGRYNDSDQWGGSGGYLPPVSASVPANDFITIRCLPVLYYPFWVTQYRYLTLTIPLHSSTILKLRIDRIPRIR